MEIRAKQQVRRVRLLINRGFQLRYMGVLAAASLLTSCVVGGVLYSIVEINWALQLQKGLGLFSETRDLLAQQRLLVVGASGVGFLVLAGLMSLWGLFLSHRVAGPVFAISRRMQKIVMEYDLMSQLQLREKDALHEVKDFLNSTLMGWQRQMEREIEWLNEMSDRLSKVQARHSGMAPIFRQSLRYLEILKKDKEKWVGSRL